MQKQKVLTTKHQSRLGWRVLVLAGCLVVWLFGSGASLKYTEDRTPSLLNPIYADDMYTVRSTELLFERLIGWDKEQKLVPMLAVSWKISKDKKSIELNLRKGVKWHDGKPFTSKDVVFTINTMTSSRAQLSDRYLAAIVKQPVPLGPLKVRVVFRRPLSKPLKWLQFKIIPAHPFAGKRISRNHVFNQRPIGTGPLMFKRWIGRKIEFKKFSAHWRDKNRMSKVTLQAIPDKNIQVAVLQYGGLDAIIRARPKDVPVFEKNRGVQLYPYSTNDWWYLGLNHKHPALKDRRVRQALMYSLDRETLRDSHLGDGNVISGPFSPNDPLYNFSVNPRSLSRSKAAKLFDQAGWKLSGANGLRKKGGKTLSLRLLVPRSKTSYKALCNGMKGQLRKVGVNIDLVWLDDAAWNRAVFTKKKFDMTMHIWNFDDLSSIRPLFYSRSSRNYINYKNKKVDALLNQAAKTTDPAIYKAIFGKIHKELHNDLPYLFLWSLTNYSALSSKVKGVSIHPFNYFHYVWSWKK